VLVEWWGGVKHYKICALMEGGITVLGSHATELQVSADKDEDPAQLSEVR
jgi:hypothetical protein